MSSPGSAQRLDKSRRATADQYPSSSRSCARRGRGSGPGLTSLADLLGEVVLFADLTYELELGFEPIDVGFLFAETRLQEHARAFVALFVARGDDLPQQPDRFTFGVERQLELLGDVLADRD